MNDSHAQNKFQLTVTSSDLVAEKIILNSRFQRVDSRAENPAVFHLREGQYTVKLLVGSKSKEKPVLLNKDRAVEFDLMPFLTPAPLPLTGIDDFLYSAAKDISKAPSIFLGVGGELFVFVRGSFGRSYISDEPSRPTAFMKGLCLKDKNGVTLLKLDTLPTFTESNGRDAFESVNIALAPGCYRLTLELENSKGLSIIQQTVVVSRGWQTQVFAQLTYYGNRQRGADISSCALFMEKMGAGFDGGKTSHEGARLIELLRIALKNQRAVLPSVIWNDLLEGRFDNPMFGIYGGHLLLADKRKTQGDLTKAIYRLRELLGEPHPDVEALAIRCHIPTSFRCDVFPMLYSSWRFLIEASTVVDSLIVPQSLPALYSGNFRSSNVWLVWGEDHEQDNKELYVLLKGLAEDMSFRESPKSVADIFNNLPRADGTVGMLPLVQYLNVPKNKIEDVLNDRELVRSDTREAPVHHQLESQEVAPSKGKWGGMAERNGRKLSAAVNESTVSGLFTVVLTVESTDPEVPLASPVQFHLHESYMNPHPTVDTVAGKATLKLSNVMGSFIVGAQADGGNTMLELELTEIPGEM